MERFLLWSVECNSGSPGPGDGELFNELETAKHRIMELFHESQYQCLQSVVFTVIDHQSDTIVHTDHYAPPEIGPNISMRKLTQVERRMRKIKQIAKDALESDVWENEISGDSAGIEQLFIHMLDALHTKGLVNREGISEIASGIDFHFLE